MNDLEILQKGINLLTQIKDLTLADRRKSFEPSDGIPPEAEALLIQFQSITIRIEKILRHLGIATMVNAYNRNFDVIKQSANDGDLMMINYALPLLRQAEGFLSDPGKISESFKLNIGIDEDVHYRFMTGDFSGATAKAFKIFKAKLYQHTGTDNVDTAVGELKKRWQLNKTLTDESRENFEKGVTHLLSSLSRFRNVEFHSEDWAIDDKQEAFYFITLISFSLDILDKYLATENQTNG